MSTTNLLEKVLDIQVDPSIDPNSLVSMTLEEINIEGLKLKNQQNDYNVKVMIHTRVCLIALIGFMALLELFVVLGSLIYLVFNNQLEQLNTIAIPLGGLAFHSYKLLEKALLFHLQPLESVLPIRQR